MKSHLLLAPMLCVTLIGCSFSQPDPGHVHAEEQGEGTAQDLQVNRLLQSELTGVTGREVVVGHVTVQPNVTLPWHWHPGEEFAYMLDGSITLTLKDQPALICKKGDAVKVPYKYVHTAVAGEHGAEILVFRVNELGQPERILVE